jgi:hypothetical protein
MSCATRDKIVLRTCHANSNIFVPMSTPAGTSCDVIAEVSSYNYESRIFKKYSPKTFLKEMLYRFEM